MSISFCSTWPSPTNPLEANPSFPHNTPISLTQECRSIDMDLIFDKYIIQSAEEANTINLEIPLVPLQRALKSAIGSTSASLRLTKKNGNPVLSLTITTSMISATNSGGGAGSGVNTAGYLPPVSRLTETQRRAAGIDKASDGAGGDEDLTGVRDHWEMSLRREREKLITQDLPVRVLHPETVQTIMQPKVRDSDVNIHLPSLVQLKAISDRFTRLASGAIGNTGISAGGGGGWGPGAGGGGGGAGGANHPKLELSATMHGRLNLRMETPEMELETTWTGLLNPELDPTMIEQPLEEHPSEVFRRAGPDKWATVRIDGKDWSKVLSVGRLQGDGRRVVACFTHEHALILYVYVPVYDTPNRGRGRDPGDGEESCLTVRIFFFALFSVSISLPLLVRIHQATFTPALPPVLAHGFMGQKRCFRPHFTPE